MERLLKYCLSFCVVLAVYSCNTKEEKIEDAFSFGQHMYQGNPNSMNAFAYVTELDSTHAEAWRELSIPYLKRGIPHLWKPHYEKAVKHNPEIWQPWRGYLYLWFYRDYKKAIADFNASDTLTPNFIDAPQGHSVDYWRGIAYLGLKDYQQSIAYFDKYITKETEDSGEDWVEVTAFLFRGIAYFEDKEYEKALYNFDKQLEYSREVSADAKYFKARIAQKNNDLVLAKQLTKEAITDFNQGYFNSRPYVETLHQIYLEDLLQLQNELNEE